MIVREVSYSRFRTKRENSKKMAFLNLWHFADNLIKQLY